MIANTNYRWTERAKLTFAKTELFKQTIKKTNNPDLRQIFSNKSLSKLHLKEILKKNCLE